MAASPELQALRRRALFGISALALAALVAVYVLSETRDDAREPASLQIVGSETMRPVVTACAEAFMTRNPQADIIVRGGGSGDGVGALLNGIADIGMTSRPLSEKEREFAGRRGIELTIAGLALDGIAVVVNAANPLSTLPLERLRQIFTGEISNWRELGGADRPILVFARAAGSGTATLFAERALAGATEAFTAQKLATNEAIVAEVAGRPDAIGYAGLGALRGAGTRVKLVALSAQADALATLPTPETLRSGAYPLARTLSFGAPAPLSASARSFIESCAGPAGQGLIQRAGYVPLTGAVP